jgi:cysteate synthase
VASAGNTARALIKVASENGIPLIVVIPKENHASLWVRKKADCVRVVATGDGSDYSDAIALAGKLCELPGFVSEGGAKNVARRDGMGTVMLSAALLIGDAPDFYFQAVGSGTGAIAAWEANTRLFESGFASKMASLQLSQNAPFLPMYEAWKAGSRRFPQMDERVAKEQISEISAKVLSNRTPPYSICGGVYDALKATSGDMWAVTNKEIAAAQALFLNWEGRDICPEAGAAVASVIQAAAAGRIKGSDVVMLNITGGGFDAAKAGSCQVEPDAIVPLEDLSDRRKIEELARRLTE